MVELINHEHELLDIEIYIGLTFFQVGFINIVLVKIYHSEEDMN